jgi:hypothetical protein
MSFFLQFINNLTAWLAGVVAVDGKTLRRSFDRASAKSPLHLVSAWVCEQRLFLGQIAVDGKSNEITALPKLLEFLALKGRVITADATHCQRATCAAIVAQGGGYVIAFRGNQGALHDDVRRLLTDRDHHPKMSPKSAMPIMAGLRPAAPPSPARSAGSRRPMPGPASRPSAQSPEGAILR